MNLKLEVVPIPVSDVDARWRVSPNLAGASAHHAGGPGRRRPAPVWVTTASAALAGIIALPAD